MGDLSPHFYWADVTHSVTAQTHGINNELPIDLKGRVISQAVLLETCRQILCDAGGVEVRFSVNSWYRCPVLNQKVGGQPTSAHLSGVATDVIPIGMNIEHAFEVLSKSPVMAEIDQLILEHDKRGNIWLHIGQHPHGEEPRHQAFKLEKGEAKRTNPS